MTDVELVNLMVAAPCNFTVSQPAGPDFNMKPGYVLPPPPDLELNGVHIRTVRNEVIGLVEQKSAIESQRDELLAALELLASPSMTCSKGNGESHIGWQPGEGLNAFERLAVARAAIARAKGGAS